MSTKLLKIGSKISSFNLQGIDDKFHRLEDFTDRKALVIIFSCNHCPYVQAYEERIKKIQSDYSSRGVEVIAINSNDDLIYPEDSFDEMKKRAVEKEFNFLYLRDEDQSVAKAFDATHTPEIFVFNSDRKLVFHGKIDDNWQDEKNVITPYLRYALNELLEGKDISVPETFTIGCTIKWK
jgi:peroxiredoxin